MKSLDVLLEHVAQGTEFHFESGLCGDWTLMMKSPPKAGLHIVTAGTCWFGVSNTQIVQHKLHAGDIVFANCHLSHYLSRSEVPAELAPQDIASFCQTQHNDHGMVCYDINNDDLSSNVLQLLPAWMILPSSEQTQSLLELVAVIRREVSSAQLGYQSVVRKLSDAIAMQLLRAAIKNGDILRGPLAALADSQLAPLITAMLDDPAKHWSVEDMANQSFLSTSAFAERCHKKTGLSPKKLLDQLRLNRGKHLLITTDWSIDKIASQVGYQSSTAFSRFFNRYVGCSASSFRASVNQNTD